MDDKSEKKQDQENFREERDVLVCELTSRVGRSAVQMEGQESEAWFGQFQAAQFGWLECRIKRSAGKCGRKGQNESVCRGMKD